MRHRHGLALLAAAVLVVHVPIGAVGQPRSTSSAGDTDMQLPRLAGQDRYETAAAIARSTHGGRDDADRPKAAVLARGDAFADALAGAPLAHHLAGPLLLTRSEELPAVTRTTLTDLLAPSATVHVLGGTTAISIDVVAQLRRDGWQVVRHAGATRYETAAAIAARMPASELAHVASGVEPADALAVAPVAARGGAPVLLTEPDVLPAATRDALANVARVELVGGPAAISTTVEDDLARRHDVVRVAGADRYATAVAVARRAPGPITAVSLASGRSWPDALAGAAHAAATDAVLLLTEPDRLPWSTAAEITERQVPVVVYGGEAVVARVVDSDVARALASDPGAPALVRIAPGRDVRADTDLVLTFDVPVGATDLEVDPPGSAAAATVDGATVTVRIPKIEGSETVALHGSVAGQDGPVRQFEERLTVVLDPPASTTAEGFTIASGTGPVAGTDGPLRTYSVEVQPATGVSLSEAVHVTSEALEDRTRGWTSRGERRFQRVGDPGAAGIRVVVATPETVDAYCARVGTNTGGIYSCWDGRRAMLNADRWTRGVSHFGSDLAAYRIYLVNHEVGHGLGFRHLDCPGTGQLAPVMMQQSKGVGSCTPNGWPYP